MTRRRVPKPAVSPLGTAIAVREHHEHEADALHCIGCARKAWPIGVEFLAVCWRKGQIAAFTVSDSGDRVRGTFNDAHGILAAEKDPIFLLNTKADLDALAGDGTERECHQCRREL